MFNKSLKSSVNSSLKFSFSMKSKSFLSSYSTRIFKFSTSISTQEKLHYSRFANSNNAFIIETDLYIPKIVLPDYAFELKLKHYIDGYTVKNMIDDHRKKFEKERVMTLKLLDEEGIDISNCTETTILSKLDHFYVSINQGEKIYKCINLTYLGNKNLGRTSEADFSFNELQNAYQNKCLSITDASISLELKAELFQKKSLNKSISKANSKLYTLLDSFIKNKFLNFSDYLEYYNRNKDIRIIKITNLFFYITLTQVVTLNLATFVFFSWDILEPMITLLTWCNLIVGYNYWVFTESDYEIESMIKWLRDFRILDKNMIAKRSESRNELVSYLEGNKNKMI